MATTLQPVPGFDAPNADAMDLHSDHGYDMGDGDIDIDVGSAPGSPIGHDDALSLQDADADVGFDLHDASGDVDDYMAEQEDLIEEDEIDYGDLELEDAGEQSFISVDVQAETVEQSNVTPASNLPSNASNNEGVEEDLIDYSDEEDEQEQPVDVHVSHGEVDQGADGAVEENIVKAPNNGVSGDVDTSTHAHDAHNDGYQVEGTEEETAETAQQPGKDESANWEQPSNHQYGDSVRTEDDGDHEDQKQNEALGDESDLSPQHESEQQHGSEEAVTSVQEQPIQQDDQAEAKAHSSQHSPDETSPLHPVTINYDGAELWLFKPLDSNDDDWLLEDESVATKAFPFLFHACRIQLGDDLNNETELGLRFDNFHNLELYEDSTPCAYSTLKEFLDIYTKLHAQDGQTNPEPFYVTLQFRPRVLSLINELKNAVRDGIGFTGLEKSIASGHSNFNNLFVDEYHEEWEEEQQDGDSEDNNEEEAQVQALPHSAEEHDNGNSVVGDDVHSHVDENNVSPSAAENDTEQHDEQYVHETEDVSQAAPATQNSISASVPASNDGGHQEDELEYSDEEEEEEESAAQSRYSSVNVGTSGSSTVQGDDITDEDVADPTDPEESHRDHGDDAQASIHDHDEGHQNDHDALEQNGTGNDESYAQYNETEEDNTTHHDGQEFAQAYEQGFEAVDYSVTEFAEVGDGYNTGNDGNAANDLWGTGETEDLHSLHTFEDGVHDVEEYNFNDDDYVDLTGGPENTAAEEASEFPDGNIDDDINFDDEEGAENQASAVASSTEPPTAASAGHSSPQGQKRALDEVDGAGDATDAKKPKL